MAEIPAPRGCSSQLRPLAACLAGIIAVAPGAGASAAVVPVLNCDDGSTGSLRDIYSDAADNEVIDLGPLTCSQITLNTATLGKGGDVFTGG